MLTRSADENAFSNRSKMLFKLFSTQVEKNGTVNGLKRGKKVLYGSIPENSDDRWPAKKRQVKEATGLRRNTVKMKALIRRFIAVLGSLRRRFRRSESASWVVVECLFEDYRIILIRIVFERTSIPMLFLDQVSITEFSRN